jgi:membrane-bound metal-dependent hydrolase YbcI (DUF457 family)
MNTYTHLLVTVAAREGLARRGIPVHLKGALLGSIMPDLPLIVLTVVYIVYYRYIDPLPAGEHIFSGRYDRLFFEDPFWVILHNMFHAPLIVALLTLVGYHAIRAGKSWGPALFWFALACGLHSLIDIFTHHNDGPLLLFPFNWQLRVITPISYWDDNHYGNIVAPLEHLLDLAILLFLGVGWIRRRIKKNQRPASCEP